MRVKVEGVRIDGRTQAWLTIERKGLVAVVRPFRSARKYILTLAEVCEIVAWKAAKRDAPPDKGGKRR